MPATPQSVKQALDQALTLHARARWPQLAGLRIRHRGAFAYIDGELPDGEILRLMRLRYLGSADLWGFALHLASTDTYENNVLHTGAPFGSAEEALDCACELYLTAPDF